MLKDFDKKQIKEIDEKLEALFDKQSKNIAEIIIAQNLKFFGALEKMDKRILHLEKYASPFWTIVRILVAAIISLLSFYVLHNGF